MKKHLSSLALSIMLVLCTVSTGCAHYSGGPWMGRVVDADTKLPIEGAVVLAVWKNDYASPPGRGTAFVDAAETLTDNNGYFKIPAQSFIGVLPDSKIYGPLFTIFKPGYGCFGYAEMGQHTGPTSWHVYPKGWKGRFEKPDAIVELTRLKTRDERKNNLYGAIPDIEIKKKAIKYMELINTELKDLGLPTYPGYKNGE